MSPVHATTGKLREGSMVFINRHEFRDEVVTKTRVKNYMKLVQGKIDPDEFSSLKDFESKFFSLECAVKRKALFNGKVQTVWASVSEKCLTLKYVLPFVVCAWTYL